MYYKPIPLFARIAGICSLLLLPLAAQAGLNKALCFSYTMPVGVDPDTKLYFAANNETLAFFGSHLIDGSEPGVEFHVAPDVDLLLNQVELSVLGEIPDCLKPLFVEVESGFDADRFPSVASPWKDVPASPLGITLEAQAGSALIGELLTDHFTGDVGRAYGALVIRADCLAELRQLDVECLDAFRSLTFQVTGRFRNDLVVPEPDAPAAFAALLLLASVQVFRRSAVAAKQRQAEAPKSSTG